MVIKRLLISFVAKKLNFSLGITVIYTATNTFIVAVILLLIITLRYDYNNVKLLNFKIFSLVAIFKCSAKKTIFYNII